jgi:hypothetical protein
MIVCLFCLSYDCVPCVRIHVRKVGGVVVGGSRFGFLNFSVSLAAGVGRDLNI